MNWGDGATTSFGPVTGVRSLTHAYSTAGVYTIAATATEGGESFTNSTSVTVLPPTALTLTAGARTGTVTPPTTFEFTVTPNTANGVRNVSLDFGDGTSIDLGGVTAATIVTKRYSSPGNYTVRATQTDALGNTTTAVVVVTVSATTAT